MLQKVLGCRKFVPNFTKLNKINTKKKAKCIATFELTTLYTAILHNLLFKVLSEVFAFKSKTRSLIGFSTSSHLKVVEDGLTSHRKMLFYHWKHSVQTRVCHFYGQRPSSTLSKPLFIFFKI